MNFRYPIFLDLTGKKCLVVGQHFEIVSKVRSLVASGASVTYVNRSAEEPIAKLAGAGSIVWERRDFSPQDLSGCFLVISSLKDNSEVFRLAEASNILCNSVDDPDHCRFSFGSVHRSGDLSIAISTNGWAPALAVRLRERFQSEIGPEYGEFIALLSELGATITARIPDFAARRKLWYQIVDSDALQLLRSGDRDRAEKTLRELLDEAIGGSGAEPSA